MCLALALRTIGMEERVILDLLPFIPFKAIYKLEFITAYVTIAFFSYSFAIFSGRIFQDYITYHFIIFFYCLPNTGSFYSILLRFTALSFSPVLVNI